MNNFAATTDDVWNRSSGSPSDYDIPRDIDSIHQICNLYMEELKRIVTIPSSFALTAVMGYVSFLSNLAYSDSIHKKGQDEIMFRNFVETYMWPNQPDCDKSGILYHVLRCGLAHSMSFYDSINSFAKKKGMSYDDCRKKLLADSTFLHDFHTSFHKVIIVNNAEAVKKTTNGYAVCPSSLLREVEIATEKFFKEAKPGTELERRVLDYVRIQPPIVPYNDKEGSTAS